jgi:hypothetical protein
LGDMIQSTHRLIRARRRVTWDARPVLIALLVVVLVVSEFFSLWKYYAVSDVSMPRLLWLLLLPILVALLAYSVLPDEIPGDGLDLGDFFQAERTTWAVLFAIINLVDFAREIGPSIGAFRTLPFEALLATAAFMLVIMAGAGLLGWSRSKRLDALALLLLGTIVIGATLGQHIRVRP